MLTVAFYDDPNSIKTKVEYALNLGLGGLMGWSLDSDKTDTLITTAFDSEFINFSLVLLILTKNVKEV